MGVSASRGHLHADITFAKPRSRYHRTRTFGRGTVCPANVPTTARGNAPTFRPVFCQKKCTIRRVGTCSDRSPVQGGVYVASGAVRARSRHSGAPDPLGLPARSWMPLGLREKRTRHATQNTAPGDGCGVRSLLLVAGVRRSRARGPVADQETKVGGGDDASGGDDAWGGDDAGGDGGDKSSGDDVGGSVAVVGSSRLGGLLRSSH